jgi:flagellar basal-body rod protein FlgB
MVTNLFSKTELYEKAIGASSMRQEVASHNLANVDTPNYKRKVVDFEKSLQEAIESTNGLVGTRTNSRHMPIGSVDLNNLEAKVNTDGARNAMRIDGNNVDINVEMSELSKNSIRYNALIQKISGSFRQLKDVIAGGSK